MHREVENFIKQHYSHDLGSESVLDVGSYDVNGSARSWITTTDYTGLDMREGPGVDVVANIEDWSPGRTFDHVVCCSMLEHCEKWVEALVNMKAMLKARGHLLVTTHTPVCPRHDYPSDYWRWLEPDWEKAFSDFLIKDVLYHGQDCMVYAQKPDLWAHRPGIYYAVPVD